MDGVDQQRPGLGLDDGIHQRERLIGTIGQQWADMPRGASIADERDGSIVSRDARGVDCETLSPESRPSIITIRSTKASNRQTSLCGLFAIFHGRIR